MNGTVKILNSGVSNEFGNLAFVCRNFIIVDFADGRGIYGPDNEIEYQDEKGNMLHNVKMVVNDLIRMKFGWDKEVAEINAHVAELNA